MELLLAYWEAIENVAMETASVGKPVYSGQAATLLLPGLQSLWGPLEFSRK